MSEVVFEKAIPVGDLPAGAMAGVKVRGWYVLICNTADGFYAMNDRCPHAAARLSIGSVRGAMVICPAHGARFDLASGKCVGGAYAAVRTFPVRVSEDWIEVGVPPRSPFVTEIPIFVS